MVAMGTGAVGIGIGPGGFVQADGIGYWLGDLGGGSWIGRAGLRAATGAHSGFGPRTLLVRAAQERYGDLTALPLTLSAGDDRRHDGCVLPGRRACAARGDLVAAQILDDAAAELARTTATAARASRAERVTAVGGLTAVGPLMQAWRRLLPEDVTEVPAVGSALDGAVLLATRSDLPHEEHVVRRSASGRVLTRSPDMVDELATEQVRPDLADLDTRSADQLVDLVLEAEATVTAALWNARDQLAMAVTLAERALLRGGRLIYVGAGTPGRLAALDAAECPPTFGTSPEQVVAVLAGGGTAAAAAVEGAEDSVGAGHADLAELAVTDRDLVVGISASGRTPYVMAALEAARAAGGRTVGIVNNPGSPVARLAEVTIELLTGRSCWPGRPG